MPVLEFGSQKIIASFVAVSSINGGYILSGKNVSLQCPSEAVRYYSHGWQSWSLTAWTDPKALPRPKPFLLNPMQVDPLYVNHPSPNGSWLGAVEFENGNILLLGALGMDSHVQYRESALQGWYEIDQKNDAELEWFAAYGSEIEVFKTYTGLLSLKLGSLTEKPKSRVWCSWYSLYTAIDENILNSIFKGLDDLPFDVLQVDDGWQQSIGDWQPNEKFPSGMKALADKIKSSGKAAGADGELTAGIHRKAGLWLAPLLVVPSSQIYQDHPDWLLINADGQPVSAGFNWGEPLFALDTTHPQVLEWLTELMKTVRHWGFDYIKLDFLYAGALPGKRTLDMPREAAYRYGLRVIREALGKDAYFLTCGTPILPSIGLCDAMRIGPDVANDWESYRDSVLLYNPATPGIKNAIRTSVNRLWLAPLVHTDPDVVYFHNDKSKMTEEQKLNLQNLAIICNFKATSDLPQLMTNKEREELKVFLTDQPAVERTGRYTFKIGQQLIDFSEATTLPQVPVGIEKLTGDLTGWLGSQPVALIILDLLGKRALEKFVSELKD